MDGILNVLKPAGMTSFDVVGFLRKVSGQKKIGHTGTLDPSAVGVLPVCFGNATKAIEFMIDKDKIYRAELTLGIATDTQDSSGRVVFSHEVQVDETAIRQTIESFTGNMKQLPPMYSAIKIGGRKLYEIAREGETVERQPRNITVFDINIIRIWKEKVDTFLVTKVLFDVHCSKGTYIRTLCHDIGEKLGCGGNMSFLVRTGAGKYSLDSAVTVEEIKKLSEENRLEEILQPVETIFSDYESIFLTEAELFKYNNGVKLEINSKIYDNNALIRVYDSNKYFLGIGEFIKEGQALYLKSKKFFK